MVKTFVNSTFKNIFSVLNYCDWVKETTQEVLDSSYPSAKYWKSSHPKHTDLAEQVIEQVIDPIQQSVVDFRTDIYFFEHRQQMAGS